MLQLPNTTSSFVPGVLSAGGAGLWHNTVVHLGPSMGGTKNVLKRFTSSSALVDEWTGGPLVRSMARYMGLTGQAQIGIACDTDEPGAVGLTRYAQKFGAAEQTAPDKIATVNFVAAEGGVFDDYELVWQTRAGGGIGAAKYRVSFDGGSTWQADQVVSSDYFSIGNGVEVELNFGTEEAPTELAADSCFFCRTTAPSISQEGLVTALESLNAQTTERFGLVLCLQGWDAETLAEVITAADAAALLGEPNLNLYSVILSFRRQDVTGEDGFGVEGSPETVQAWKEDATTVTVSGLRTYKAFGEYRQTDPGAKTKPRRLAAESFGLKFISSKYNQELMEVSLGSLSDVVTSYYSEVIGDILYPTKWLVGRKHPGYAGEYLAAGLLNSPIDSEMVWALQRRIADELLYRFRKFAPLTYGKMAFTKAGKITAASATHWSKQFRDQAVGVIDGRVLLSVTVDCSDSYSEDGQVNLVVNWDFTTGTPIGQVILSGSLTLS